MSIARKSLVGLAAGLMIFAYVAPCFAELKIDGIAGESQDANHQVEVKDESHAAAPTSVCIYVIGTVICVSK